mgnify:CR=1 FL=1
MVRPENGNRISKIDTYLNCAEVFAYRSTCIKRKYGAVIVKDDVVNKTYSNKVSKYLQLAQKLHDEKGLKKTFIIPVILSINGLISKHSVRRLIEFEFNIKWPPIVRELLITQMKDIMFYLNQHIDRVELGTETPSDSTRQETQTGSVLQDEGLTSPS